MPHVWSSKYDLIRTNGFPTAHSYILVIAESEVSNSGSVLCVRENEIKCYMKKQTKKYI